ncbi:TonB-dependent receptor [Terriglobus aquaticus]|uniref:Carboxypeptidase regulatory-like domain-containing protein n=1 Tax=Terriglobus aquaticus TaxID=940139 RepID=A0ABW9KL37_9BACT|nr:TonB-dependent receptor [Terriglobus aquaticus]
MRRVLTIFTVLLLGYFVPILAAQAQTAAVHGHVSDETGAVIPDATVTATSTTGKTITTKSSSDGAYSFNGLAPGTYRIAASYPGFDLKQPQTFVAKGQTASLNLVLTVSSVVQQVTVDATDHSTLSVDAANNASAVVLSGSALDSLADNPDDLASDLQALAGPTAGPSGGSFYIDGFSSGEMPPKESIREIRINQNPFSPEFDKLGLGRIEIFTKPGSDQFHGSGSFNIGSDTFNSRNPYASVKAPFLLREYGVNVVGPLNHRTTFTFDGRYEDTDNGAVINGATLDLTSLAIISPYSTVYSVAQMQTIITPKIDYQLTKNNTLSVRYRVTDADIPNSGLGGFNLVETAYHAHSLSQTTQVVETAVLGATAVNETRFQFFNVSSSNFADNPGVSIQVLNAFTGGGSPVGNSSDVQRNYELQNLTTLNRGSHVVHFGARLRATSDSNLSEQDFNGTFTFGGVTGPELDANNQPILDGSGNPILVPISSIEQYQRTASLQKAGYSAAQIRALGGGASQFTLSAGNPLLSLSQVDLGLFVGDTWKIKQNISLDAGLRYEVQNNIPDHRDWAPRLAVSWSPKRAQQKLVLRGGFGVFYDRFVLSNTLTALRYNGITQQQYVVDNPDFYPTVPPLSTVASSQAGQVIQQNAPNLRAPYYIQSLISVEQQLPFHTSLAISYSNTHGLHQLRSEDINARLPGSGSYPLGNSNPVFQAQSEGLYNQNQLILNANSQATKKISLFGSYTLGYARSNTDGPTTFPANPYSSAGEYGPASTDVRNFETFGGTIQTLWKTTWSPLLTVRSGAPFNITVGRDLYGTTLFNGRPGIALNQNKAGLIQTSYGLLDPTPSAGETILGRNSGRGPGSVQLNMRVSKTLGFGSSGSGLDASGKPKESKPRYSLVLTLQVRNVTNHNNPGLIIGNIASPLFGRANQSAGANTQTGTSFSESATNRRLELQMRFAF